MKLKISTIVMYSLFFFSTPLWAARTKASERKRINKMMAEMHAKEMALPVESLETQLRLAEYAGKYGDVIERLKNPKGLSREQFKVGARAAALHCMKKRDMRFKGKHRGAFEAVRCEEEEDLHHNIKYVTTIKGKWASKNRKVCVSLAPVVLARSRRHGHKPRITLNLSVRAGGRQEQFELPVKQEEFVNFALRKANKVEFEEA